MKKTIIGLACLLGTMLCTTLAQDAASPENTLIGTWSVRIDKYEDVWTFKENGSVTSAKEPQTRGSWKKEDKCILIQWDQVSKTGHKTWESFTLPLNKNETQGTNWRGAKVTARKIEEASTTQVSTPEQAEEMKISQTGSLAGIGAVMDKNNDKVVITTVIPGGPAEKAGLKIGQVITAINGVPTGSMQLRDAVKLIRGPKGSEVELTLTEPPSATTHRVSIVRDIVSVAVSYATGHVLDANSDVSVENLPPSVVKTVPQSGDTNVDPALSQITVTFSKDMMDQSMAWCNIPNHQDAFPKMIGSHGDTKFQTDKRTCVINVALEAEKTYAIWINMDHYQDFRDFAGHPAVPYLLVFKTGQRK